MEHKKRKLRQQKGSTMDVHLSPVQGSDIAKEMIPNTQPSKRRKVSQKTVVTVKIEPNDGKKKIVGPPADSWSWRKYGQKPIKGSPYPRGYYRCSNSKSCSAKKQVERCRTDSSVLIITYTSIHNHPGPNLHTNTTQKAQEEEKQQQQDQEPLMNSRQDKTDKDHFHDSLSPFRTSQYTIVNQEGNFFTENLENTHYNSQGFLFDQVPSSCCPRHLFTFSTTKTEESDSIYDELEELPTFSYFSSFMGTSFLEEKNSINPP